MSSCFVRLSHLVEEFGSARLEVGSLLPVDDVLLGEFVEALLELGEESLCLSLVYCCAELLEQRTHGLCVVAVVQTTFLVLTDALERGLVISHFFSEKLIMNSEKEKGSTMWYGSRVTSHPSSCFGSP